MNTRELIEKLDMLGESAHDRAMEAHVAWQASGDANILHDYFYWSGKATAYKGIAAGLVLRDMVTTDVDAEASCP